jgi:osmotically-inducible protein OsmY
MPDLTLAPVLKAQGKATKTQRKAVKRKGVKAVAKTGGKAGKTGGKAAKTGGKAAKTGGKAFKTAGKARATVFSAVGRATGRPVTRRDKALSATSRVAGTGAQVAVTGARVWWAGAWLWVNQDSGSRKRTRTVPIAIVAAAGGAGIQFLLDPAEGKHRRKMLIDRGSSTARDLARQGEKRARYTSGLAKGAAARATGKSASPADDKTLADRVRTEIFRRDDAPKGEVNVSVVDGVVYLRGELSSSEEIERLGRDARAVPGVRDVQNLLHAPGVAAPTGAAG